MRFEAKVEFGKEYKDSITGFKGKCVSVDFWMNGCVRVGLQAKIKASDTNLPDVKWIDESQIDGIKKINPREGPQKDPPGMSIK